MPEALGAKADRHALLNERIIAFLCQREALCPFIYWGGGVKIRGTVEHARQIFLRTLFSHPFNFPTCDMQLEKK